jgi:hypothetical protein
MELPFSGIAIVTNVAVLHIWVKIQLIASRYSIIIFAAYGDDGVRTTAAGKHFLTAIFTNSVFYDT